MLGKNGTSVVGPWLVVVPGGGVVPEGGGGVCESEDVRLGDVVSVTDCVGDDVVVWDGLDVVVCDGDDVVVCDGLDVVDSVGLEVVLDGGLDVVVEVVWGSHVSSRISLFDIVTEPVVASAAPWMEAPVPSVMLCEAMIVPSR